MASAEYTIDVDMTALDDLTPFGLTSPSGADVQGYVRVSCADAVNEMAEEWMRLQMLSTTRDVAPDEIDEDPPAEPHILSAPGGVLYSDGSVVEPDQSEPGEGDEVTDAPNVGEQGPEQA